MDKGFDTNFLFGCHRSIEDMRNAGMSLTFIGCALQEIRAAAIQEKRLRVEALLRNNPPHHPAGTYICEQLEEEYPK